MRKILEYGIYLIVFCLPLYLIRFSVFGLPTNVLEIMVGVLFLVWLIRQITNSEQRTANKKLFIVHWSLFIAILLVLIGVTISTIFSWDLQLSAGIWKSWFIIPLIFFVILITSIKIKQINPITFKKSNGVKNIFYSLIASGFVVSIISLIYLITGNLDIHGRLQGFYTSPNYLAMYLSPIFLILLTEIIFTKTRVVLFVVLCSLFAVVLFFTKSFGAWLGVLGAVLFSLLVYFYKKKNRKLFYTILIVGILIILVLGYLKLFILSEGGKSYDARILIWQRAWEAFKMNPVIGIGPGTFENYFPLYPKWGVPQPHNLYLAFLLQTGIIGFIGFVWLLVWFYKKSFELLKAQNFLVIIIMSIMVYILIHGIVDTTYWKNDLAVVFWLILGLLSIVSHSPYSKTSNNFLEEKEINQ